MTPRRKKLLLLGFGVAVGLLLAEAALRLYSAVMPAKADPLARLTVSITVPDARLGIRPNPEHPEHDANGFRNPSVPKDAFVVAMGDSQTYGTGVRAENSWPRQLEAQSGRRVYSMASGGWGPTQSLLIFDRALSLKPRLIVEAFYDGNDLYDCFSMVYSRIQFPGLRTADPAAADAIREAEKQEPLEERFSRLYRLGRDGGGEEPEPTFLGRVSGFLTDHSRLYRLSGVLWRAGMRRLRRLTRPRVRNEAAAGETASQPFESHGLKTVFTPSYRAGPMDLNDPRIAEGHRIALEALKEMNARSLAAGTSFLVLLIPTKELVFRDLVTGTPVDAGDYRRAVESEELLRARTRAFLDREEIPYLDALPALRESLSQGVEPYPDSEDGHPNPAGYRAIARVIADEMKKRGLAASPAGKPPGQSSSNSFRQSAFSS